MPYAAHTNALRMCGAFLSHVPRELQQAEHILDHNYTGHDYVGHNCMGYVPCELQQTKHIAEREVVAACEKCASF